MEHEHGPLLERMRRDLYDGNGRKPIVREVEINRKRMDQVWADLYHNPDTGDSGLVADVRYIKRAMLWVKGMAAAVSTGAVSGVVWVIVQLL